MDAIEFEFGEGKYKFVSDEYRTIVVCIDPFRTICIPIKYAEHLCLLTTDRLSAFLEAHVDELIQFNESIVHVWNTNCSEYCLDLNCVTMYLEDQRLIDFFEGWLSRLRPRVKSARN